MNDTQMDRCLSFAGWLEKYNERLIKIDAWEFTTWFSGDFENLTTGNGEPDSPRLVQVDEANYYDSGSGCHTSACAGGWAAVIYPQWLITPREGNAWIMAGPKMLAAATPERREQLENADTETTAIHEFFGCSDPFIRPGGREDEGPIQPVDVARALRQRVDYQRRCQALDAAAGITGA